MIFLIPIVSFVVSFIIFPAMIPRLKRAGIVGYNMNNDRQEVIPEMGEFVPARLS